MSNAVETTTPAAKRDHSAAGVLKRFSAYNVEPRRITRREGWNPRFDFGEIAELAKSVKANGLLVPLRLKRIKPTEGRDFDFEVVDGDRRLTAIELILEQDAQAFSEGIPAIIVDKSQDDLTSLVQMFEANTGKPFLPLEEAAAFQRLHDAGVAQGVKKGEIFKWISAKVGRSDIYVWETMQLLGADDSVKDAVQQKKIGTTAAKQIAIHAKGDKAKQKELVAKAQAAGKDKTKKAALKQELDDAKRAKHAKKGRALKIKPLDEAALSALGAKVAAEVVSKLADAGKAADFDIRDWIAKDDKLALAFTYGALEALKSAAGQKINLAI